MIIEKYKRFPQVLLCDYILINNSVCFCVSVYDQRQESGGGGEAGDSWQVCGPARRPGQPQQSRPLPRPAGATELLNTLSLGGC